MKLTIPQLKRQIQNNDISNLYLFYGEEKYLLNAYISNIKDKSVIDFPEFNFFEFTDETAEYEQFSSFVLSYPQMSDKKMVVLKNCGFLQNAAYKDSMVKLLSELPSYAVVIFAEETLGKAKKELVSLIEEKGVVTEFEKQSLENLRAWVNRKFALANKKMTIDDMNYLVSLCACSLDKLEVECSKLIAGTEEEVISRSHIDSLVTVPVEYKVFTMADCLLNKNSNEAYSLLHEFKVNKEQPTEILAIIYSSISEILMFKNLIGLGKNPELYLAPNRKWLGKKYRALATKQDGKKLRDVMKMCFLYDEKIKTGMIDGFTALEVVIASMLG
ncbi:MAG: DNA polymerase III subunit delta [Clostridia bacterium]|nr:DNA polymerase III subunit delta [Clostridia bacterium]